MQRLDHVSITVRDLRRVRGFHDSIAAALQIFTCARRGEADYRGRGRRHRIIGERIMSRRSRRWIVVAALALAGVAALVAVAQLPYLPLVHGTDAQEVERLARWLELRPGTRVADVGAGDGTFAVALARRVGTAGLVYATEIDAESLADIRDAAAKAGLSNVKVISGAISSTNLPEGCCDAVFSRFVYHHLTDGPAIDADVFRALRPGGRLAIIDFEPGGIMDWIGRPETADRHGGHGTPAETVLKEVTAAGFQVVRGPEPWRGRSYGLLFRRP